MAANRNAANRMERGERDPLLRRQSDGEEGVSIHDVMERTSFLHFGFGETRGTSDAFAATVVGFMLIGMALMCLLCWKLTLTEYNAVGVILQDFGVYNSSSPALFAPPVPGNATAAVGDLADVHSLMWLTVSHELLHVAWWFFRAACYATGVCAALGLICFMWPNVWCVHLAACSEQSSYHRPCALSALLSSHPDP